MIHIRLKKPLAAPEGEIVEATLVSAGGAADDAHHADGSLIEAGRVAANERQVAATPCPSCGTPRVGNSRFCVSCGTPIGTPSEPGVSAGESGANASALPTHSFHCQNCGSEVATSMEQRSYVCPFCGSSYVTELPLEQGRQRPEFVIGFEVTAEQAKEKYFAWMGKNSWFHPGDLSQKAVSEKQKGVYLPFWHFSMHADSDWSANIGEYWYRTETYTVRDANGKTVTKTRRVQETEWFPLRGEHHRYYFGYLVPATKGITPSESLAIQPFQLSAMSRYRPFYLAGWMAEEYCIDMPAAIEQTKAEFKRRQEQEVARFLPGDTHSGLVVHTEFRLNGSDLVLLPIHVLSYRYRDRVFRFLVNGQTGKVVGEKPWSAVRITSFVIFLVVLVALAILAIVFFANR